MSVAQHEPNLNIDIVNKMTAQLGNSVCYRKQTLAGLETIQELEKP